MQFKTGSNSLTAPLNARSAGDRSVANVTGAVFVTQTLPFTENAYNVTYSHTLVVAGGVKSNQMGVSNGAVDVHVDNQTIATVSTAANG